MNNDLFSELGPVELSALRQISVPLAAEAGRVLFAEGDAADAAYVIEAGEVSISIEKSGKPEEIARLGRGDFFGEMAIFENDMRAATARAIAPVQLWVVQKDDFLQLVKRQPDLAARLSSVLQSRRIELFLREQLVSATGVGARDLHVSIKGDPSLRETAFSRERYLSTVDKVFPQLLPSLRTLLFETAACRVMVGMNNGEVRVGTVVAPFLEEVHNVSKITSPAYLARHFPAMDYDTKVQVMREANQCLARLPAMQALSGSWRHLFTNVHDAWSPVPRARLEAVLDRLADLRSIPNFYLRNLCLNVAQDAVHMQFNCDGTHIVSTGEYQRFLQENVEASA